MADVGGGSWHQAGATAGKEKKESGVGAGRCGADERESAAEQGVRRINDGDLIR